VCSQVNAHTSAIDALWAGVPIISLARESMASRVSASINSAAHMALTVARNADGELTFAQRTVFSLSGSAVSEGRPSAVA
jgi:predicted O-linked N-acetylglucosamine transferase (SPINDLY family)